VNAWVNASSANPRHGFFKLDDQFFTPTFAVSEPLMDAFESLMQELIDYRLAAYEVRRVTSEGVSNVIPFQRKTPTRSELPYFPDLRIACGHFRSSSSEVTEHRSLGLG
jgi:hypothetical protein